jgi:O-antigen/teichoic acid export membrane protein
LTHSRLLTALALIFFQVLGLIIPLLTLPMLSAALGVGGFGQVMMTQAVVLLAVMWVDSGFNVQSQQDAARDVEAEILKPQALLNNLIARAYCTLQAVCILLFIPLCVPSITYPLLLASLPLLIGTILFPQWWLIATGRGFLLGLVTVLGRSVSALLVWWLVRNESDILLATFAISLGASLSGTMLLSVWLLPIYRNHRFLSWSAWREYVRRIKPTLLPAFLANACAQLPVVALGAFVGAVQTGLFTAADRLTRAGAHLLSLIEQSVVTQWLQPIAGKAQSLQKMRRRILVFIFCTLAGGLLIAWYLAPWVIQFLYNEGFMDAVMILRVLLLWVWLQTIRRLLVAVFWLIEGDIQAQAKIQWAEIFLYLLLVCGIALFSYMRSEITWGLTTAYGLCLIEASLVGLFFVLNKFRPQ